MSLMWVVYAIETLTYEGSVMLTLGVMILLGLVAVAVINRVWLKDTVVHASESLVDGAVVVLSQDLGSWSAGTKLTIKSMYTSLERVYFTADGAKPFDLDLVKRSIAPPARHVTKHKKIVAPRGLKTFAIVLITLHVLIPSRKTAIMMGGAWVAQYIYTHEKTGELGDLAFVAAKEQLKSWATEVPELKSSLLGVVDMAVEETKQAVEAAEAVTESVVNQ